MESIGDATEMARARLNQLLTERLVHDFEANGADVVAWLRGDRPLEYLRMVRLALPSGAASPPIRDGKTGFRFKRLRRMMARFR